MISVNGGVPDYTIRWIDGNTSFDRTDLSAGEHTITISDGNNCEVEQLIVIDAPNSIEVTTVLDHLGCHGDSSGRISLVTSGGVGGFIFEWQDDLGNDDFLSNLSAGEYSVIVRDANDCEIEVTSELTQPNPISSTEEIKNISCYGEQDGACLLYTSDAADE